MVERITEFAPAKLNLCLHVTGQNDDGYHLLQSLVCFASVGDRVTVTQSDALSLDVIGPFASAFEPGADNLVLQAARLMGVDRAHITLEKNLPLASGIGGGSSDAAATLRALSRLCDVPLPPASEALRLGADVPVCLTPSLIRMEGIGEQITDLGPAPFMDFVLVNPGVGVPTPDIFRALHSKTKPPLPDNMPDPFDTEYWLDWLKTTRNDLTSPAMNQAPIITDVLDSLSTQPGAILTRMSGSGATCFGIFEDFQSRDAAAKTIKTAHPDWWVVTAEDWSS